MTESRRQRRVSSAVRQVISELLVSELRDPRLRENGLVTVTGVAVTADLTTATVYVTHSSDSAEQIQQMLDGFASAAPFLRTEVARHLRLKRAPDLRFRADPATASGRRVDAILRDLDQDGEPRER